MVFSFGSAKILAQYINIFSRGWLACHSVRCYAVCRLIQSNTSKSFQRRPSLNSLSLLSRNRCIQWNRRISASGGSRSDLQLVMLLQWSTQWQIQPHDVSTTYRLEDNNSTETFIISSTNASVVDAARMSHTLKRILASDAPLSVFRIDKISRVRYRYLVS